MNEKLIAVERDVFLAGYHKAFMMFIDPCNFCKTCPEDQAECANPKKARPSPEGMAVDVFDTARAAGFPIDVLTDYDQAMNRFGILLVE
jgi:predicted metal-binding protein